MRTGSTSPQVLTTAVRGPWLHERTLVLSSVMFAFIGIWPTAAVVLCDLVSTAYYIGGIVESQIGRAAPWFILGVMLFSYGVRSVYIESCSMFVRGGVYRIVKEAMGDRLAKVAVSALMFDYILTGPISAVSAGHYLVRLFNSLLRYFQFHTGVHERYGAAGVALAVVFYFYQANVRGIPTSSGKALKIMRVMTVMAVIMITWCLITISVRSDARKVPPWRPDLARKADREGRPTINEVTGKQEDPLGWVAASPLGPELRPESVHWLSALGALGVLIAFGHSILAMSGEETLAQVYREVKAPKLRNFRWAAFIVFLYSLTITGLISFFAVMIIPDDVRPGFQENLISGLAMHVVGPHWARLGLNGLVVVVGFLVLSGAVNTSLLGANGVLNRVTEDGVLPDWFQRPHKKYGTTWRLLTLIAGLQAATIVLSGGDVIILGEAYAFGVVWSLVAMSLSMLLLRFTQPGRPRGYRVPLNVRLGRLELPVGLALIFLVLLAAALANLATKTVATISGIAFTAAFLVAFAVTEHYRRRQGTENGEGRTHKHLEQFQGEAIPRLTRQALGLERPGCKLVAVYSPDDLAALEACLDETNTDTADIVVVAAHPADASGAYGDPEHTESVMVSGRTPPEPEPPFGVVDRALMTAVVTRAELAGKPLVPVIILTDDPRSAVLRAAHDLGAGELILGDESRGHGQASAGENARPDLRILESPLPVRRRRYRWRSPASVQLRGTRRFRRDRPDGSWQPCRSRHEVPGTRWSRCRWRFWPQPGTPR